MKVGIGGEYQPEFLGSKNGMLSPVPIFSIRRAGSAEQFRGPRDSASIALIDFGNLRAGPAGKFVRARKSEDYSELSGLGDVKAAVELGGFVEYYPVDWFRGRVELRQGIGGHHGAVADVSADFIVPVIEQTYHLGWSALHVEKHRGDFTLFRRRCGACAGLGIAHV